MRPARLITSAIAIVVAATAASAADYIWSDAFERRACDGTGCTYCSPADPQPLCGTHSHCSPQPDASSLCTYPDGSGTQGALCSSLDACAGPYACVDAGMGSTCAHWCSRPGGSECTAFPGTSCVAFSSPALIGAQEWGVCL